MDEVTGDVEEAQTAERRMLPLLKGLWARYAARKFESAFILVCLLTIGGISWFVDAKLAFLNFYFLPVLLAGYFLDARSAVMGAVLSIAWTIFFVVLQPDEFYLEPSRFGLYLHLLTWGSFLVLSGVLVGRLNEAVMRKFDVVRRISEDRRQSQRKLSDDLLQLDEKARALDMLRTRLESVLYSAMDERVARRAVNQELANEKREIAVLGADLVDFGREEGHSAPEVFLTQLNRLFAEFEPVLDSFQGHLDHFVGEGLLAEFGVPTPRRQDSLLAVLAGLRMQERLGRGDSRWKLRVGIAHGDALVGLVGTSRRRNYTVLGDVVGLAARLQQFCPIGSVCVDGATHRRIERWFVTRKLFTRVTFTESLALETTLRDLLRRLENGEESLPLYLEAGRISCELGFTAQTLQLCRRALERFPEQKDQIEARAAEAATLAAADRTVLIRGHAQKVSAFEVLSLKNPFDAVDRLPVGCEAYIEELVAVERLKRDLLIPVEALDGSIGNSQITAALSGALADAMGLSDDDRRCAILAGFLHDAGMGSLPENVLNRENDEAGAGEDREAMERHPQAGLAAVESFGIVLPEAASEAILQHHENLDGSGYPRGRRGDQVGLLGRIVRLADHYANLTSWRPWREAWDADAALGELARQAEAGKLDARILQVFNRMVRNGLRETPASYPIRSESPATED